MKTYSYRKTGERMTVQGNDLISLPFLKQNHYLKFIAKYIWNRHYVNIKDMQLKTTSGYTCVTQPVSL